MSMDINGKIILSKHSELQQANIKALADAEIKDGDRLPLAIKDMGSCEIYPQSISHNPNGRSVYIAQSQRQVSLYPIIPTAGTFESHNHNLDVIYFFSHPPKRRRVSYESGIRPVSMLASASTLCTFYETAAWNHFILYMHISLGGLFNICENGGALCTP